MARVPRKLAELARRKSGPVFKKIISSASLGRLRLKHLRIPALNEDFFHYESSISAKGYENVTIVLNSDENEPEWWAIVKRAEEALPSILKLEPMLRRRAIPAIRRLRHRRFKWDHWHGSDKRLTGAMILEQIMFTDTGPVEMSYSGGKPCHAHTVRLTLGARLGLRGVSFDG
jgi:hypothetical protein